MTKKKKKKEALPGLIRGKLDALPWRWCPLSGTRPAPFAGRRSVAALGLFPCPLGNLVASISIPRPWGRPSYFVGSIAHVSPTRLGFWGHRASPALKRDKSTSFLWSYYSTRRGFCQDLFSFFFLFPEGWGLVAPADGGYPPSLLPQCGIEGGETRQPVLPHTGLTGPQASEEVPMEPDVFNFHGSDLLCFTVVIIPWGTGFVNPFFQIYLILFTLTILAPEYSAFPSFKNLRLGLTRVMVDSSPQKLMVIS